MLFLFLFYMSAWPSLPEFMSLHTRTYTKRRCNANKQCQIRVKEKKSRKKVQKLQNDRQIIQGTRLSTGDEFEREREQQGSHRVTDQRTEFGLGDVQHHLLTCKNAHAFNSFLFVISLLKNCDGRQMYDSGNIISTNPSRHSLKII